MRYSKAGAIHYQPFAVTVQPEDFYGQLGAKASFTARVEDETVSYQWEVSTDGGKSWKDSKAGDAKTATISGIVLTEIRIGQLYRCRITDADGNVAYSEPGGMYLDEFAILEQPVDCAALIGDKASFSVTAYHYDNGGVLTQKVYLCHKWDSSFLLFLFITVFPNRGIYPNHCIISHSVFFQSIFGFSEIKGNVF